MRKRSISLAVCTVLGLLLTVPASAGIIAVDFDPGILDEISRIDATDAAASLGRLYSEAQQTTLNAVSSNSTREAHLSTLNQVASQLQSVLSSVSAAPHITASNGPGLVLDRLNAFNYDTAATLLEGPTGVAGRLTSETQGYSEAIDLQAAPNLKLAIGSDRAANNNANAAKNSLQTALTAETLQTQRNAQVMSSAGEIQDTADALSAEIEKRKDEIGDARADILANAGCQTETACPNLGNVQREYLAVLRASEEALIKISDDVVAVGLAALSVDTAAGQLQHAVNLSRNGVQASLAVLEPSIIPLGVSTFSSLGQFTGGGTSLTGDGFFFNYTGNIFTTSGLDIPSIFGIGSFQFANFPGMLSQADASLSITLTRSLQIQGFSPFTASETLTLPILYTATPNDCGALGPCPPEVAADTVKISAADASYSGVVFENMSGSFDFYGSINSPLKLADVRVTPGSIGAVRVDVIPVSVPEPGTGALLGIGVLGLLARRLTRLRLGEQSPR